MNRTVSSRRPTALVTLALVVAASGLLAGCVPSAGAPDPSSSPIASRTATPDPSSSTGPGLTATPTTAPSAQAGESLSVADSAYGRVPGELGFFWYVVVIDNPEGKGIYPVAGVQIDALDADGEVVDTATHRRIIPEGRSAVGGSFTRVGDAEIAELRVTLPDPDRAVDEPEPVTASVAVSDLVAQAPTGGRTAVSGILTGPFTDPDQVITVVVIARDPDGRIIGAEVGHPEPRQTGETLPFDVLFPEGLPEDTVYEAYAGAPD